MKIWEFTYNSLEEAINKFNNLDIIREYAKKYNNKYSADLLIGEDKYILTVKVGD